MFLPSLNQALKYWGGRGGLSRIKVVGVSKRFGRTVALDNVSLEVRKGELFAILGPSGCGKTTLLRVIAGFEVPDSGRVFFDDEDVTFKRPDERGAVMVFQNWALWPHLKVYDNIAYGLKVKKLPKSEIDKRVRWVLDLLGLKGLENRYPHQLSGGQQQRVALARALVVEPRVLLLDEPLSNLDARLRLKLRGEIRKLQKELGITAIYVTHDQEEALAVADRVAVMRAGKIVEVSTPEEIYSNPKKLFTAFFIGKTSVALARVEDVAKDVVYVRVGSLPIKAVNHGVQKNDRDAIIVFKAEKARSEPEWKDYVEVKGKVVVAMYMGSMVEVRLSPLGYNRDLAFYLPEIEPPKPGSEYSVYLPLNAVHAYTVRGEENLVKELLEEE